MLCSLCLHGEDSFRVRKVHSLNILSDSQKEQSVNIGINDSVAFFLPEDLSYIEGLEIQVKIPSAISEWRDCVVCSLYDQIRPEPEPSQIDYSGNKMFFTPLPSKLSWNIKIPLKKDNNIKDNQYITKINSIPDISSGFVFLRFQPAMKGIPEETLNSQLTVCVKTILINKGKLSLKVNKNNVDGDFQVFVDEMPFTEEKPLLATGMHNLHIQSQDFRNETQSFYIDQSKTTELMISLKSIAPTLIVTAPENTQIFFDDEKFSETGKEVVVTEGEHIVKFLLGGYEVIRTMSIENGKTYNASLTIDLDISEE